MKKKCSTFHFNQSSHNSLNSVVFYLTGAIMSSRSSAFILTDIMRAFSLDERVKDRQETYIQEKPPGGKFVLHFN